MAYYTLALFLICTTVAIEIVIKQSNRAFIETLISGNDWLESWNYRDIDKQPISEALQLLIIIDVTFY